MSEYQLADGWVCSKDGAWLPGSYETRTAARLAYRVDPETLDRAWEAKRDRRGIVSHHFSEAEVLALTL